MGDFLWIGSVSLGKVWPSSRFRVWIKDMQQDLAVVNFYKFVPIADVEAMRKEQGDFCRQRQLRGSLLFAAEGLNVALAGARKDLEAYLAYTSQIVGPLDAIWSETSVIPFKRLVTKIKDYIVVFDKEHWVYDAEVGKASYLAPTEFAAKLEDQDKDVVVLDTRNYYEVDYGTFEKAEHLDIRHFRQFPKAFLEKYGDQKDKTFLMVCTGGIRCERAAVFAHKQGFKKVYQLHGGIIRYFKERGAKGYRGNCFVFDDRWALTPELKEAPDGPHPDQLDRIPQIARV